MKALTLPLLLVSLIVLSGCKVKLNSSVSSGGVTWTATQNGSFSSHSSFMGEETKVDIKTVDYDLTVNGKPYGKVDKGDTIRVEEDKVYRNDKEISPVTKTE